MTRGKVNGFSLRTVATQRSRDDDSRVAKVKKPRRPVFHAELGDMLKDKRVVRGWSQAQTVRFAKRTAGQLTENQLRYLEAGKVENPDPDTLRALCQLYDLPYAELASRYFSATYAVPVRVEDSGIVTIEPGAADDAPAFAAVRLLGDEIAAGPPLTVEDTSTAGHLAFSRTWLDRVGVSKPLCVKVGRYERSMMETIQPGEVVLLDCADERRADPKTDRIYAVNVDGGSTLKRVVRGTRDLWLVSDNPDKVEYPTRILELEEDQSLLEVIVGEVMWKGQPV